MQIRQVAAVVATAALVAAAAAADQTWTGTISDSACGAKHESGGEMGEEMNDRDCTLACVKGGSKFVLVADGKIYKVANQDAAGLREHAGESVRITGTLEGDTITASTIVK